MKTIPVPSPIISTACIFSIPTACRRNRLAICCAGSSAAIASARNGRIGAERYADTPPSRVERQGAAFVCRPCDLADPDRGPQHPGRSRLVGAGLAFYLRRTKRLNDPGIAFESCPRSTPCWCRTGTTTISTSRRCRACTQSSRRASSRRSATTHHARRGCSDPGRGFDWNDRIELGNGVAVTLVPTRHWTARGLFDRNKALWASFVLETPVGQNLHRLRFRLRQGRAFPQRRETHGRCGWRSCRSAPMSRAGSCATST